MFHDLESKEQRFSIFWPMFGKSWAWPDLASFQWLLRTRSLDSPVIQLLDGQCFTVPWSIAGFSLKHSHWLSALPSERNVLVHNVTWLDLYSFWKCSFRHSRASTLVPWPHRQLKFPGLSGGVGDIGTASGEFVRGMSMCDLLWPVVAGSSAQGRLRGYPHSKAMQSMSPTPRPLLRSVLRPALTEAAR